MENPTNPPESLSLLNCTPECCIKPGIPEAGIDQNTVPILEAKQIEIILALTGNAPVPGMDNGPAW